MSKNLKLVVIDSGHGKRNHLVGYLRIRPSFKSYDSVLSIFSFLHRMAHHSGPVMRARWGKAEEVMIKRYCSFIPASKYHRQRI